MRVSERRAKLAWAIPSVSKVNKVKPSAMMLASIAEVRRRSRAKLAWAMPCKEEEKHGLIAEVRTDGAARGEPNEFELSRVATEVDKMSRRKTKLNQGRRSRIRE